MNPAPEWQLVIHASDCVACADCGEPVCPVCIEDPGVEDAHYGMCACPGPTQDDEYEYREADGVLEARRL